MKKYSIKGQLLVAGAGALSIGELDGGSTVTVGAAAIPEGIKIMDS